MTLISLAFTGCHRSYYRDQADAEAAALIAEEGEPPALGAAGAGSLTSTHSPGLFDPFDPDAPPMPTDDPVSHELMHCVDGKPGYPGWGLQRAHAVC